MPSIKDLIGDGAAGRGSFCDDPVVENKKGLKINNSKSRIKAVPERIDISSNAQHILADREFQNRIGWNLTSRLLAIFKDKKLQENKTQTEKEDESMLLQDYVKFAHLINNDQTQEEGLGTIAFSVAIVKCALLQRDEINEQSRNISVLSKRLSALEAEIKSKNK